MEWVNIWPIIVSVLGVAIAWGSSQSDNRNTRKELENTKQDLKETKCAVTNDFNKIYQKIDEMKEANNKNSQAMAELKGEVNTKLDIIIKKLEL